MTELNTIAKMSAMELEEENGKLRRDIESLNHTIDTLHEAITYKDGLIEGLKFSIRCNGISGGEVGGPNE